MALQCHVGTPNEFASQCSARGLAAPVPKPWLASVCGGPRPGADARPGFSRPSAACAGLSWPEAFWEGAEHQLEDAEVRGYPQLRTGRMPTTPASTVCVEPQMACTFVEKGWKQPLSPEPALQSDAAQVGSGGLWDDEDGEDGEVFDLPCKWGPNASAVVRNSPRSSHFCGSDGHPELCARPCFPFARGVCRDGDACSFCHLPHPRRPIHMDKRRRTALRGTPPERVCELVLPVLQRKVATIDDMPETRDRFGALVWCCGLDSIEVGADLPCPRLERDERLMVKVFESKNVAMLVLELRRRLGDVFPGVNSTADALLEHLRRVVA